MKKTNLIIPLALLSAFSLGGNAMAKSQTAMVKKLPAISITSLHAQDICDYSDPSNVCVYNASGVPVSVTIPQFENVYDVPVQTGTMQPFGYGEEQDPIYVTINSMYGTFTAPMPNHGPYLEIDPPNKANPNKLVIKIR